MDEDVVVEAEPPDMPVESATETRPRHPTEKGQAYQLDMKATQLKEIVKRLFHKTQLIKHLFESDTEQGIFRQCYSEWLVCYEEYLNCRRLYKALLTDADQDQFNETDATFTSFKEQAETYSLRLSSNHGASESLVQPSDSASQTGGRRRKGHSRSGSRASSISSISSARLKEAQRKAEITMKLQTLERKRELEIEKLNLKVKEEQLELDTQMAISNARSKVLDNLDQRSEIEQKNVSDVDKNPDHVLFKVHKSQMRADAPSFTARHVKTEPNVCTTPVNVMCNSDTAKRVDAADHVQLENTVDDVAHALLYQNVHTSPVDVNVHTNKSVLGNTTTDYVTNVGTYANTESVSDAVTHPRYTENFMPKATSHISDQPQIVQQSDIECVVRQLRKPTPEIKMFGGNPLEYKRFMRQFHAKVASNCDTYEEKLNYLEQYTTDEAKMIVTGYGYLDLKELDRRYGNDETIANAFVKRALDWPAVKPDDTTGLDRFGIFLAECQNAIQSIESVKVLEYPENLKRLVGKLPYFLHDKWRTIVLQTKENGGIVRFSQLVGLVKSEASKATDPTYGKDALRMEPKPAANKIQGSSASFCTEDLLKRLGGTGKPMRITIDTMGAPHTMKTYSVQGLVVGDINMENFIALPNVYTKDKMPVSSSHIPREEDLKRWSHLSGVELSNIDEGIDLLIGNDVPDAYTPLECRTGPRGTPHATRSLLGWIPWNVMRPLTSEAKSTVTVNRASVIALQELEEVKLLDRQMQKAIMLDFPERVTNDKREYSREDKRFIEKINSSIKLVDGHYSISLPFKGESITMPNNEDQARQRLKSLRTKMLKDERYHEDYKTFMQDIVDKGYAERVPVKELDRADGKTWYIPHHGVYHPNKPGKIRVVFDCSATYLGASLNNSLLQGPNLTNNLLSVLLRFREENVALMADVESMYYQVKVPREDCDLLRYLWWPNGDVNETPEAYRMLVHLFGAVPSPSCAIAALLKTADDNKDKFEPEVADLVHRSFYVDDCLVSIQSDIEAIELIQNVTSLCQLGGFTLTKWTTNRRTVLGTIPVEERAKATRDLDLGSEQLPAERALGVHWSTENDTLGYNIKKQHKPATRRGILSVVSSVYDPLGLVSPFVLKAKTILQELCKQGVDWDQDIKGEHLTEWQQWTDGLPRLQEVEVARCYKPHDFGEIAVADMHTFSDASESGYGVTIYLRLTNENGQHHCCLVMAKSRVAPLKRISIPRMALTAATVAVRLAKVVREELNYKVDNVYFWTDSMSVLRYIANESSRFHTFVSHRLTVIHDGSSPDKWNYVPSKLNPADAASRGLTIDKFLKLDNWFQGPSFLWLSEAQWPKPETTDGCRNLQLNDPEVKRIPVAATTEVQTNMTIDYLLERHSGWLRLRSAVGWLILAVERFKSIRLNTPRPRKDEIQDLLRKTYLPVEKLQQAETLLVKNEQLQFAKEISAIRDGKCVTKSSHLRKLDLFLSDGVLRVGGRLQLANTPYRAKHPIILPKSSRLSERIMEFSHKCVGHLGKNATLAHLRQRYWIIGAGSSIKKLTGRCVTCRKYRAKTVDQKMSNLPVDRLTENQAPFTAVGMDFFGPFEVKRGRALVKRYGVVFTCLASRAVHLEVAHSLTTDACINAIRRLIARRGPVILIRSDNGTNLVGSERELREEIDRWNQQQLHTALQQNNIKWLFNPPAASHHGGVWERMIRTIRKILYSILKEQTLKLDDEGLSTLFCEAESIING